MANDFPGKGTVAVLKTAPDTVLDDYRQLMNLAGYQQALPKDKDTLLKINISWQTWYPACSTAPWQLEGVIKTMQADGYNLIGAHNDTGGGATADREANNTQKYTPDKYGGACTWQGQTDVKSV